MATCKDCLHLPVCNNVYFNLDILRQRYCGMYLPFGKQPSWIPVSERLPEIVKTTKAGRNTYRKSDRVLCACLQKNGKKIVKEGYMEFFNDYPEPSWIIPGTIHSVSHWMPLPEFPQEEPNE